MIILRMANCQLLLAIVSYWQLKVGYCDHNLIFQTKLKHNTVIKTRASSRTNEITIIINCQDYIHSSGIETYVEGTEVVDTLERPASIIGNTLTQVKLI